MKSKNVDIRYTQPGRYLVWSLERDRSLEQPLGEFKSEDELLRAVESEAQNDSELGAKIAGDERLVVRHISDTRPLKGDE